MNYLTGGIGVVSFVYIAFTILTVEYIDNGFVALLCGFAAFASFLGVMIWMIHVFMYEEQFNLHSKLVLCWIVLISGLVLIVNLCIISQSTVNWFHALTKFNQIVLIVWISSFFVYFTLIIFDIFLHAMNLRLRLIGYEQLIQKHIQTLEKEEVVTIETPLITQQEPENKIMEPPPVKWTENANNPELYRNLDLNNIQIRSLYPIENK
jgi:hypothetical protein